MATFDETFDRILPRLVAAYQSGRLVPFIGSGMSRPTAGSWLDLVEGLEAHVSDAGRANLKNENTPAQKDRDTPSPPPDELIRRAHAAVRLLKARGADTLIAATKKATFGSKDTIGPIPRQTKALAKIYWPLVLTTNYDNLYEAAFWRLQSDGNPTSYSVVGRDPEDCQRILNSLSVAGRALIWAMQGYLDAPKCFQDANSIPNHKPLTEQLVIGHEEYRRVTYREIHFRRAFAEVFRQRSLLFLGSGIKETYIQELFGEILELYGPSTRPHYALLSKDDRVDDKFLYFMLSRFQIVVAPYDDHGKVTESLKKLKKAIETLHDKQYVWTWGSRTAAPNCPRAGTPELEVVRGPLAVGAPADRHTPMDREHCLAVSAVGGYDERFYIATETKGILTNWGVKVKQDDSRLYIELANDPTSPWMGYDNQRHVFAIRPRSKKDKTDLTDIYTASLTLLGRACDKYRYIHTQLHGVGGDERRFPPRFSFIQMVRAYANWRLDFTEKTIKLIIYVEDPSIIRDVASGRIDVLELLICPDLRFWTEIVFKSGEMDRCLFQESSDEKLETIADKLNLPRDDGDEWEFMVTPPPELEISRRRLSSDGKSTLGAIGIVPGSTVHFKHCSRDRESGPSEVRR